MGADPYIPDSDGLMAIHISAKMGHYEMIELLLENGVPINKKKVDGNTILHEALANS
jgi:ankyrin repeat protein